ncbi:MAG: lipid-A-disaccharide synthase [Cyanobacteria bacterium SID2]|nr:lipid-A-disaccharide synthase [Cyanobacteria bacterium SID2]MBP0005894.1 lipid-A-disaccharide synthase [Cyanobacteria bacterium SBC]
MTYRVFISTGEVSGDLQGALLVEALYQQARERSIDLEILALGGNRMENAGAEILAKTDGIGSVGLLESLPFVLPTLSVQRRALAALKTNPPDIVVLIDYMGPNLSLGNTLKHRFPGLPVVYYIAPQTWVWSPSDRDALRLVELSDRLLAIFPEEARYFEEKGASVTWVGHPLVDRLADAPSRDTARMALNLERDTCSIALLPASRYQELKSLVPPIFQAARQLQDRLPNVRFWIPLSLEIYREALAHAVDEYGLRAEIVRDRTLEILAAADLAITKSGTVNLELAILDVPQVVVYAVHPVTAWIARKLLGFNIPFMSPPNLVQMKSIVPELLQEAVTPDNIVRESLDLLLDLDRRRKTLDDYREMRTCLGTLGVCDRAAREILGMMKL